MKPLITISLCALLMGHCAFAQVPSYVPLNGLVAWYPFSGTVNDLSGNGNTPVNSGATFIPDRFGSANCALSFDGVSSVLELNAPNFKFSEIGQFTYSLWINKQVQSNAGVVLMSGTTSSGYFISLLQGDSFQQFGTNKQQSAWIWATCPHNLNVWDHYVAVYNAGSMSFYQNGVLVGTAIYTYAGAIADFMPLYFGRGLPGGGNNFLGYMDDIGVWTRALSAQEVSDLYMMPTVVSAPALSEGFQLYPNPAIGRIIIKTANLSVASVYSISDQTGRVVASGDLNEQEQSLDISNLTPGIYVLQAAGVRKTFQVGHN